MSKLRPALHQTALDMPTEVTDSGMGRLSDRGFEDFMRRTKLPGEDRYLLVAEARRARESEARLLEALHFALAVLGEPVTRRLQMENEVFCYDISSLEKHLRAAIDKAEGKP